MSISRLYYKRTLGLITIMVVLLSAFVACVTIPTIFPAKADPNWLTGWQYRKKITIDHTKVTADLTNFPILVNISDSDLATHAQSNGYDIAFTDNSVNKLSHEVELYNSGSGRLVAWVKMPSLSSTVDTVLYMYYGNPSATNQQDVTGTWDSNYAIVLHMKESLGTLHDSTSYNIDGTPYGGVSQNITGKIDGAASFDGSNDYIDCGNNLLNFGTGDFTISLWLSAPPQAADYTGILKRLDYVNEAVYTVRCGGSYTGSNRAALQFAVANSTTGVWRYLDIPNVLDGQWHYAVGLRNGDAWSVYIDGVLAKSTTGAGSINVNTPNQLLIGVHKTNYLNGKVDEIRLSKIAKSASWISTEYNNQNSPSAFYNVGSEEAPQGPPTVSDPSPADGMIEVPASLSELSFSLTDVNNDLINYVVTTSPNIGSGSGTGVTNGRYYVSVSGLQPNTAYTWRVDAIDPTGSGQLTTATFGFRTSGIQGQSWLTGWQYRKSHVITAATGAGTGYQTRVKVSFSTSSPTWFTVLPTNIPVFTTTDVSSNGTVFAGDMNYQVHKSTDSGVTFSKIFTIPAQSNPWGAQAGMVYTVFVDSRDYLLISAGSTNRLYRSTNGGTSFSEVLNLNRPSNDGTLISMTEDASGNLYAAEYGNVPPARLWKSTDGGATWSWLRNWDARHLHTVKFNSYNGWLYVIVGENSDGSQTEYQTVWRSKDGGSSWQLVIARGSGTDTKYSPMEFIGNGVYLGQDRNGQYDTNLIQKIEDDGVSEPFTPVTVYNNPYPSAIMPGPGATKLNDTIIFTTSSESYTATCQVVMSKDGSNWTVLNAQTVSTTYRWINELTIHPRKGIVYGCINGNYAYYIAAPSTPRPLPLQSPPDTIFTEGHCKTDFGDIRFTDDDGMTLLDYWMETKTDNDTAIFWVKVADDLSSFNRTIYVYYGKSDATTTSDPDNTFLFFDGFNADLSKWTILSGSWTIESGNLTIQPPVGSGNNYLVTKSTFATSNIAIRTKMRSIQAGTTQAHVGMLWHANDLTGTSHRNDQVFFRPHSTGPTEAGNIQPAYYDGAGPYSGMWFYGDKKGSYYNWETWYTVEVRIPTSGNIELYGNDVCWHNWDNQQFANNHVGLVAHEGGKDYFDYTAIRKYVTPEPSHGSWGSEEQSQCSLTLNIIGGGWIEKSPDQTTYNYDTVVTLTAHANAGWSFDHWSGDLDGSVNPTTLTMTRNMTVTTYFTLPQLYVNPSPIQKGPGDTYTTFQTSVMVEKIADLRGFDFNLTWDNNLIVLMSVDYTTTLNNMWGSGNWFIGYDVSGPGYYKLSAVSTSTGFTGTTPTPMATLTFIVKAAEGQTPMHFALVKLSNSQAQSIQAEVTDGTYQVTGPQYKPVLQMTPSTATCRKYHESFTVQANVTNAITVDGFSFTLYYSPTLMSYVSVSWGEFGPGTITNVDPVNGILEGHVTGTAMSGNRWLLNITFQDLATMIWKQGQSNELDGQVWFHYAQLSFSGIQNLEYQEGGLDQITVNNVAFKFIPIQGDITNDGVVDIYDLRTVAAFFDVKQGDPLWSTASAYDLNGNGVIDIYDLVLIGANWS